jgi:hypothetical protein
MNKLSPFESAILQAVGRMSVLKFFPTDTLTRDGIMQLIAQMVTTPEQADWLGCAMVEHFNEWPGPMALRAMVSQRWMPADGRSADMQGFGGTLEVQIENRAITASQQYKQITTGARRLLGEIEPRLLEAPSDPSVPRRAEQHRRWNAVCAALPAMQKNFRRICTEFATSQDLERREQILRQFERTVWKQEAS